MKLFKTEKPKLIFYVVRATSESKMKAPFIEESTAVEYRGRQEKD